MDQHVSPSARLHQRRRRMLQVIALLNAGFCASLLLLILTVGEGVTAATLPALGALGALILVCGVVWLLARQGQVTWGSHLFFGALILGTALVIIPEEAVSLGVPTLFLPIVAAPLLVRYRWSWGYALITWSVYSAIMAATVTLPIALVASTLFGGYAALLALFAYLTARELYRALDESQAVAQDLQALGDALEQQVAARTADLQAALGTVKQREQTLQTTLTALEQRTTAFQALSVPILPVTANTLVVPLVGDLDPERLVLLRTVVLASVEQRGVRRVIFDVTGVTVIDTSVGHGVWQIVQALMLLGAHAVLVGVRPEVAQTLVHLEIALPLETHADLAAALGHGGALYGPDRGHAPRV